MKPSPSGYFRSAGSFSLMRWERHEVLCILNSSFVKYYYAHIQVYSQRLPTEIMDHAGGDDNEGVAVVGFEVPTSPDSSYNNPIPGNEDEAREPPLAPPHLNQTLLSFPPSQDDSSSLPLPQNVILNHLYIEKESSRSVVALGITHRYRSKFVTVVLYKPVQRRGT
uniref:Association with the SNF1 complex (ASC) domain-containing protein n=1 Tax=Ananas comosus var. bracteatus TaxID=296719 RepID=A0A6V7QLQ2_ANACO|nr:unnamed protein product [Ananas comosus var. bracteatus]